MYIVTTSNPSKCAIVSSEEKLIELFRLMHFKKRAIAVENLKQYGFDADNLPALEEFRKQVFDLKMGLTESNFLYAEYLMCTAKTFQELNKSAFNQLTVFKAELDAIGIDKPNPTSITQSELLAIIGPAIIRE